MGSLLFYVFLEDLILSSEPLFRICKLSDPAIKGFTHTLSSFAASEGQSSTLA